MWVVWSSKLYKLTCHLRSSFLASFQNGFWTRWVSMQVSFVSLRSWELYDWPDWHVPCDSNLPSRTVLGWWHHSFHPIFVHSFAISGSFCQGEPSPKNNRFSGRKPGWNMIPSIVSYSGLWDQILSWELEMLLQIPEPLKKTRKHTANMLLFMLFFRDTFFFRPPRVIIKTPMIPDQSGFQPRDFRIFCSHSWAGISGYYQGLEKKWSTAKSRLVWIMLVWYGTKTTSHATQESGFYSGKLTKLWKIHHFDGGKPGKTGGFPIAICFTRSCQVWILQPSGTSGAVDSYPWIDNFFPTIDVDNLDCNHCAVPGRFSSNWDYRQKPFVCRRAKYPALIWRFVEIDVYHDSAIDSGYMGWQYRPVCNWSNSLCEWKCVFPLLYLFCSFHRHWRLCLLESHYGHHCGDGLLDFFRWLQFTSKGTGNGQKERDWKSDSALRLKRKKQRIQKEFGIYTKWDNLFQTFVFGFHVKFRGCRGYYQGWIKASNLNPPLVHYMKREYLEPLKKCRI